MENNALACKDLVQMDPPLNTAKALNAAAASCLTAAAVCRAWKAGGDAAVVTNTAAAALRAANIALEAVVTDEPWDRTLEEPATRQARLAYAAWFALLAGTDEHGAANDLDCATQLFRAAAAP